MTSIFCGLPINLIFFLQGFAFVLLSCELLFPLQIFITNLKFMILFFFYFMKQLFGKLDMNF